MVCPTVTVSQTNDDEFADITLHDCGVHANNNEIVVDDFGTDGVVRFFNEWRNAHTADRLRFDVEVLVDGQPIEFNVVEESQFRVQTGPNTYEVAVGPTAGHTVPLDVFVDSLPLGQDMAYDVFITSDPIKDN